MESEGPPEPYDGVTVQQRMQQEVHWSYGVLFRHYVREGELEQQHADLG